MNSIVMKRDIMRLAGHILLCLEIVVTNFGSRLTACMYGSVCLYDIACDIKMCCARLEYLNIGAGRAALSYSTSDWNFPDALTIYGIPFLMSNASDLEKDFHIAGRTHELNID